MTAAAAPVASPQELYAPTGTVLVTGGTGALGSHVARWLAANGARNLVLTGRRGEDTPGTAALVAELGALGTQVTVTACDVADRDALAEVLAAIPATAPLSAVFHAAGVVDDGVVEALTPDRFAATLRPKADGVRHLHELTLGADLQAFVLFSSVAGVIGTAGQGNYAAANAYLDAFAEVRLAQGLPATAIAWGPWAGEGMAAATDTGAERMRRVGMHPLASAPALEILGSAISACESGLAVVDVEWERFAPAAFAARPAPLLSRLPRPHRAAPELLPMTPTEADGLRARLADLEPERRNRHLLDLVRSQAAHVLGHGEASAVDADLPFRDLGFDSLTTLELRNGLAAATGLRTAPRPCCSTTTRVRRELAVHLRAELSDDTESASTQTTADQRSDPTRHDRRSDRHLDRHERPVPWAASPRPQTCRQLLADGRDAIGDFPADRGWDLGRPGRALRRRARRLPGTGAGDFDADFFGISPREALVMDPAATTRCWRPSWEARWSTPEWTRWSL